jgi:hypothetical protein
MPEQAQNIKAAARTETAESAILLIFIFSSFLARRRRFGAPAKGLRVFSPILL